MLDEAKNINKSLSALGNVIAALSEGTVSANIASLLLASHHRGAYLVRLIFGDVTDDVCRSRKPTSLTGTAR